MKGLHIADINTSLSKVLLQIVPQLQRASLGSMSFHRLPILVHDELGEVPLDGIEQRTTLALLQELPQRMRLVPVDVYLGEQIELGSLLNAGEVFDLLVGSRFLVTELVAGER